MHNSNFIVILQAKFLAMSIMEDNYGVIFADSGETLSECPKDLSGEYIVPEGVLDIERGAFSECAALTSIIIPDSVTFIGEYAFSDCSGLTSIKLPYHVIKVEEGTFMGCTNLETLIIKNPKIDIDDESCAFLNCPLKKIVIPKGSKEHFKMLKGFKDYRRIMVEEK